MCRRRHQLQHLPSLTALQTSEAFFSMPRLHALLLAVAHFMRSCEYEYALSRHPKLIKLICRVQFQRMFGRRCSTLLHLPTHDTARSNLATSQGGQHTHARGCAQPVWPLAAVDGVPSATPWSQDVFDSRGLSARKAAGGASLSAVVEAGAQSVGS